MNDPRVIPFAEEPLPAAEPPPHETAPRGKSWPRRLWGWCWKGTLGFLAASVLSALLFRFIPIPLTGLQAWRVGEALREGRQPRLDKRWVPLAEMSPHLEKAAIGSEDQKFYEHRGFDWEAIRKAREYNATHARRKHGASTISQQTAKNVFLWPARSWLRKGPEVWFTTLIETLWPKRRILEVYLNVIETGDGVYGVEAAARKYFRKPAARLTREEAALLIACLPNPRKWNPAAPTPYIRRRQQAILRAMTGRGPPPEPVPESEDSASAPDPPPEPAPGATSAPEATPVPAPATEPESGSAPAPEPLSAP